MFHAALPPTSCVVAADTAAAAAINRTDSRDHITPFAAISNSPLLWCSAGHPPLSSLKISQTMKTERDIERDCVVDYYVCMSFALYRGDMGSDFFE
ncbi:hypothetical protein QJS04_geneDACA016162 [Acorus gramineus]|uniref:Secreted protein n=1 Tax=Acorus gramineus TaxID=55184 RepID=A0AAV9AP40_ACOGR|nr:hypothetical protein QJS04_geneDACA016162 [Acorus gramineus]